MKLNRQNHNRKKQNRQGNSYRLSVPTSLGSYMPDSLETTLKYTDSFVQKNNAGQQWIYWRMRMGDLFDPDPLIASGSVSGFAELSAIYRRYIVVKITIKSSICNREVFPVSIQSAPSDIDLASIIVSGSTALSLGEYPLATRTHILSAVGGMDKIEFTRSVDLPTFTGQRGAYLNSQTYSALNNASPAVQTFWNFSVSSAPNLVTGIEQRTTYYYRVIWTQRQQGVV